jgi:hypothetical protein
MFDILLLFILLIILYYSIKKYNINKENITNLMPLNDFTKEKFLNSKESSEPKWYANTWYGNLYLKNDRKSYSSIYNQDLKINDNNNSGEKTYHFTPYVPDLAIKLFDTNSNNIIINQPEFVNIRENDNDIDIILQKYRENNIPKNEKIKDIYDNLIPTYKTKNNKYNNTDKLNNAASNLLYYDPSTFKYDDNNDDNNDDKILPYDIKVNDLQSAFYII